MNKETEQKLRTFIKEKIRFNTKTQVLGIENFDPTNQKHQDEVINRIIKLADEVYGGSGPSIRSHRQLGSSWTVVYKTHTGDTAQKNYISPIEVLSPFNSSAIKEVEIVFAGSTD